MTDTEYLRLGGWSRQRIGAYRHCAKRGFRLPTWMLLQHSLDTLNNVYESRRERIAMIRIARDSGLGVAPGATPETEPSDVD